MIIFLITMAIVISMQMLFPSLRIWVSKGYLKLRDKRTAYIFDNYYLDCKKFFMYCFKAVPCTTYVNNVDMGKAYKHVADAYKDKIMHIYQACFYNWDSRKHEFDRTVFVLNNKMIIELDDNIVTILYANKNYPLADDLLRTMIAYKFEKKQENFEINIITWDKDGLSLKKLDIKPAIVDVGLYYNDDFRDIDNTLTSRLNQQNDKGIVLLHGLPGTGKTTYLRSLIGKLKKKVLFVSPSVAGNLMNPEFIDLLVDNPNSVVIIEDAENIIMDRKHNSDSSVSNLLNLSDGLLSDCLSVQIICTFNNSLSLVDSALMRKGRLIAKYEFGKLSAEKAQALSKHLGFDKIINHPMTIAEIANQHDKQYEAKKVEIVGFRRQEVEMN